MEEVKAVVDAMTDNWFSPRGPKLEEMGSRLAETIGRKYGWPVSSGTAAIHLALLGLGVGPGDIVAVPSYTCSPGVYPVSYVGATPAFIDCEKETYGMDPDDLERKLDLLGRAGHRVKAAIPVHLYMGACQARVFDILRAHGCLIIEDACEVDGARSRDNLQYLGSMPERSDVACFSFRGDKVLTAMGTGGVFLTDDAELFRRMKLYSDLGIRNDSTAARYRDLEVCGFNYEISNPAAAFAIAQINRLAEIIAARQKAASLWHQALKWWSEEGLGTPRTDMVPMQDYAGASWYQFPIRFEGLGSWQELDALIDRLRERGVGLIPPFWPMHLQSRVYPDAPRDCPVAEECAGKVLLFPCYPDLNGSDIEYMVSVIGKEYSELVGSAKESRAAV
jgi:perosamine synthetase